MLYRATHQQLHHTGCWLSFRYKGCWCPVKTTPGKFLVTCHGRNSQINEQSNLQVSSQRQRQHRAINCFHCLHCLNCLHCLLSILPTLLTLSPLLHFLNHLHCLHLHYFRTLYSILKAGASGVLKYRHNGLWQPYAVPWSDGGGRTDHTFTIDQWTIIIIINQTLALSQC